VSDAVAPLADGPAPRTERRPVGRPRHYDDEVERNLVMDAAYRALRDQGSDFTIAQVLAAGGVSTRSFYRHFPSKDALLGALYRGDAEQASRRLRHRVGAAGTAAAAVGAWIDEIFSFLGHAPRAERVAVLGSVTTGRPDSAAAVAEARQLLVAPLVEAVTGGIGDGSFVAVDAAVAADLVAAAVMHAAGLGSPGGGAARHDEAQVLAFCLRALGAGAPGGAARP